MTASRLVRLGPGGFSLVEIMLAVVILAGLGGALMSMLSGNAQVGARAGEMQMATLIGARVMDRLVALEYPMLEHRLVTSGPDGALDLGQMDAHLGRGRPGRDGRDGGGRFSHDEGGLPAMNTVESQTLTVDGFTYTGRYHLEEEEAGSGLMKVKVHLTWTRYGLASSKAPGQLDLMRYVVDALADLNAREPLPEAP